MTASPQRFVAPRVLLPSVEQSSIGLRLLAGRWSSLRTWALAALMTAAAGCQTTREILPQPLPGFADRMVRPTKSPTTPSPKPTLAPPVSSEPKSRVAPPPPAPLPEDPSEFSPTEYDPLPELDEMRPTAGERPAPGEPSWAGRFRELTDNDAAPQSSRSLAATGLELSSPATVSGRAFQVVLGGPVFESDDQPINDAVPINLLPVYTEPSPLPAELAAPPLPLSNGRNLLAEAPRVGQPIDDEPLPIIRPRGLTVSPAALAVVESALPPQVWPHIPAQTPVLAEKPIQLGEPELDVQPQPEPVLVQQPTVVKEPLSLSAAGESNTEPAALPMPERTANADTGPSLFR